MKLRYGAAVGRWSVLAAATLILSSCVVVEEPGPGPGPRPPRPDEPRFCTANYDPVCARRGGDRRTFGNSCEARNAGYRIIRDGECRGGGGSGGGGDDGPPRFCTREYNPVCARRGRDIRTFGNACTAEADGYRIIAPGEC